MAREFKTLVKGLIGRRCPKDLIRWIGRPFGARVGPKKGLEGKVGGSEVGFHLWVGFLHNWEGILGKVEARKGILGRQGF